MTKKENVKRGAVGGGKVKELLKGFMQSERKCAEKMCHDVAVSSFATKGHCITFIVHITVFSVKLVVFHIWLFAVILG